MRRSLMTAIPGLLKPRVSGAAIEWLFRAEFNGPDIEAEDMPSELGAPYVEVGGPIAIYPGASPGEAAISVTSGELVIAPPVNNGNGRAAGPAFARTPGLTMFVDVRYVTGDARARFGWGKTANAAPSSAAFYMLVTGQLGTYPGGVDASIASPDDGRYAVTLFEVGSAFYRIQDGAGILLWIAYENSDALLYPIIGAHHERGGTRAWDNFGVCLLSAPFTDYTLLASVNEAEPESGATYETAADAIHDLALTLPVSPEEGDTIGLRYRMQDADNYWSAYLRYSGTGWDVRVDSVANGSPTQRLNATNVGTPSLLRVICDGNLHNVYTLEGTTWTKQNGQINVSYLNDETTVEIAYTAGSATSFRSYSRINMLEYARPN